jgi:hypothetical protein
MKSSSVGGGGSLPGGPAGERAPRRVRSFPAFRHGRAPHELFHRRLGRRLAPSDGERLAIARTPARCCNRAPSARSPPRDPFGRDCEGDPASPDSPNLHGTRRRDARRFFRCPGCGKFRDIAFRHGAAEHHGRIAERMESASLPDPARRAGGGRGRSPARRSRRAASCRRGDRVGWKRRPAPDRGRSSGRSIGDRRSKPTPLTSTIARPISSPAPST